jgi:hypothetical protein
MKGALIAAGTIILGTLIYVMVGMALAGVG